jgi:hypothetical protein
VQGFEQGQWGTLANMTSFQLHVTSWADPPAAEPNYPVRSPYVEFFWMPLIGPSAMFLLWRLDAYLDNEPDGHTFDLDELGRQLGLGSSESEHAPLARALSRLVRFSMARRTNAGGIAIRRAVGPLPPHYLSSLSPVLQEVHRSALSDGRVCGPGPLATVP